MEENEALDPGRVGFFGAQTEMAETGDGAHFVEQTRLGTEIVCLSVDAINRSSEFK